MQGTSMSPRVLFVGMNPGEPKGALIRRHSALGRLHEWAAKLELTTFSFVNCQHRPGGFRDEHVDVEFLRQAVSGFDRVIALGNDASRNLKRLGVAHHRMPHPSYRNRVFNDPSAEERVLTEARDYVYG